MSYSVVHITRSLLCKGGLEADSEGGSTWFPFPFDCCWQEHLRTPAFLIASDVAHQSMLPYALVVEEAALAEDNRQNTPFYAPKKPPGDDFAALAWAFGQGRHTAPRERSLDCSTGFCGGLRSLDNIAVF